MKKSVCLGLSALLFGIVLFGEFAVVYAKAAPSPIFSGMTQVAPILITKNSQIELQKEELIFDLPKMPDTYYDSVDDFLAYPSSVTARYTLHNPTDTNSVVKFTLPINNYYEYENPDYAYSSNEKDDMQKYTARVNGEKVDWNYRFLYSRNAYSLSSWAENKNEDFPNMGSTHTDMSNALDCLDCEGKLVDGFYSPDLPVTKYSYVVDMGDYDGGNIPHAGCKTSLAEDNLDGSKTRVFASGLSYRWGDAQIDLLRTRKFDVYVVGEQFFTAPEWKVYDTFTLEVERSETIRLTATKTMTFEEFALADYPKNVDISKTEWYNGFVCCARLRGTYVGYRNLYASDFQRWIEFDAEIAPNTTAVVEFSRPVYPMIDTLGEATYEYLYYYTPSELNTQEQLLVTIKTKAERVHQTPQMEIISKDGVICGYTFSVLNAEECKLEFSFYGLGGERTNRKKTNRLSCNATLYGVMGEAFGLFVLFVGVLLANKRR